METIYAIVEKEDDFVVFELYKNRKKAEKRMKILNKNYDEYKIRSWILN